MEIAVEIRDIIFKWVGIWWLANRLTDVVLYARAWWTNRAARMNDYADAECEPAANVAAEDMEPTDEPA